MRYLEFETQKEFKAFVRKKGLTVKEYFETYEPKFDLFTNQKMPFNQSGKYATKHEIKNYLIRDFLHKRHMAKWLMDQYKPEQREYIIKKLKFRAKDKKWKFAPSQVECRSLQDVPSLNVVDYCNDEKIWNELGLPRKYQYIDFSPEFKGLSNTILAIDSRERKPLKFDIKTVDSKFAFGDYCFIQEPYFCNVFIERKSIQDLWGTMSNGFGRFCKEVERAKKQDGHLIVVVDYSFSKAEEYNEKKKYSKATASFVFHRIRELCQEYDNIQFVFSGGRKESVELIKKIGILGNRVKNIDLQYASDMRKI
jgi:hypothetical protein